MNKIHICTVGGQPIPIYQGIIHAQPNHVIYVCSDTSISEAQRIHTIVPANITSEFILFSARNIEKIYKDTRKIKENINPDISEISINISGGLKPWSIALFEEFRDLPKLSIFYIDQNGEIIDLILKKSKQIHIPINIKDSFKLNNHSPNYTSFSEITSEDFQCAREVEELRNFNIGDFSELQNFLKERSDQITKTLNNGSFFCWDKEHKDFQVELYKKNKSMRKVLFSPNVRSILLNSAWFELKMVKILRQWEHSKDLLWNCVFQSKNNQDKNEIDIIVETNHKPFFFECKTHIYTPVDIDKFNSVRNLYGGKGAKGVLISYNSLRANAKEKCSDHKLLHISYLDYKPEDFKAALFKLLTEELLKSNA